MARVFALGKDRWDPTNRFETSWILPPYVLGFCRALVSIFQFVVLLYSIGFYCSNERRGGCAAAGNTFSYFTVLTYWGLAFYFAVAAVHTLTYAATGRALLDRLPRALQALHSAYYTSVVVYPFIVTVVYWGVLFRPGALSAPFDLFSNVSEHALNSAFALFEIIVPRTSPPPWLHLLWLVVGLALYLALAYVTRATKGFYTYSFLDPRKNGGLVAAYVFGIAVGCAIVFALAWGAIWLRRWATEAKMGMRGKLSSKAEWRRNDEDVEMTGHQEQWSERGKAVQESAR